MKLLLEMNLSPEWGPVLATVGWQAIHWSTVGKATAADTEIMAWAKASGYIVFTNDLDFGALLHATGAHAPSVIQIRGEDIRTASAGMVVISALQAALQDLAAGALVTIDPRKMRISMLPLRPTSL
ncbi:hypothetical protein Ga0100231_022515 [Opitutaceae bacterium TAV4]|nr:hypothetical protein Ga0100231_022515 [Opitutaceae bacterium TAV4]RRK00636.1 hypothetical protein Ga0100230_022745 [Opitutaceae bacterium TAV3]